MQVWGTNDTCFSSQLSALLLLWPHLGAQGGGEGGGGREVGEGRRRREGLEEGGGDLEVGGGEEGAVEGFGHRTGQGEGDPGGQGNSRGLTKII